MMLAIMLLTAASAWAQDFTVTYNIGFTGSISSRQAFITRGDNSSLTTTWGHGISVLWPENESHGVDDEFDVTIKPDHELDAYSSNGNKLFKTEATTTFTFTTAASNHYLIKDVVIKDGSNNVVGSSKNANAKTTSVSVASGKDIVHVVVTLTCDPAHFEQTATNEYTIKTATGWDLFCDLLAFNSKGVFDGKTVKLGADISVSRMAGGSYHDFTGTFDGQGHTLTVSYGTAASPLDAQYVAPFPNTTDNGGSQPTFRNLTIDGNIYEAYTGNQDHHHVGGLIGHLYGTVTIEHCTSNVSITSTGGAGGFVGLCENTVSFIDCVSSAVIHSAGGNNSGFVAWSRSNGYEINFAGCVFNGKLLQINGNGNSNGGFIGWKGEAKTVTITNSLCAPAALAVGETMADGNSATFSREHADYAATITNCYYTRTLGDAQGKAPHSITAGNHVAITFDGTATVYSVSGITTYLNENQNENSFNPVLKVGNTYYSGNGNTVILTLDPNDGSILSGYTATAGTLETTSSYLSTAHCQLTMPDEDVTINGTIATEYRITYELNGGTVATANPTTYTVQTPTFTLVNPTKRKYTFMGWTGTGLTQPTKTVTIAQGSTGHRAYTANWLVNVLEPTAVQASGITTTSATISWTARAGETAWDIFITNDANEVPDDDTTPTVSGTTSNPYSLTRLTLGTYYYVYVRAIKGTEASFWSSPAIFHTKADPVSLPYSYGFDDETLPISWTTHVENTNNCGINIWEGALAFKVGSRTDLVAVSPEFDAAYSLNEYQVSFDACYANLNDTRMEAGKLAIGVMTDPDNLFTFKQIKEVKITDGYPTYGRYTVRLNHYTGTGNYIAIKNSYVRNGYVLIDNIEVTALPACLEPTDLAVATTGYDATVTWQSEATGVSYDVAFSTSETNHPENCIVGQTTATTYDLSSNTQFGDNYVYVRTNYGQTGYSVWVGTHFVINYYAPYIQSHDEEGITGVKFGSGEHIVNKFDENGIPSSKPYYGDYSNLVGDIQANTDATIEITSHTANEDTGEEFHYVFAIWIDLNKNLLFEDNELLWIDEAANGNATLNATITIPANTPEGNYRMRIYGADEYLNDFYNNGVINWDAPHDACYDARWAHVCDFTVHVIAADPCRPPVRLGTTLTAEAGNTFKADLHWTPNCATPEATWTLYWKKSNDAAYTSVSISGNPTYTLTGLDTETDYEFYLTAHMESETSAPSKVCHFTTPCYPVSVFPWAENFDDLTVANSIPAGWNNSEGTIDDASYKWCYTTEEWGYGVCNGTSHDDSKCVRFNSVNPSNRQTNYLKSIPLNLPADTPMQLTFWYKNPMGGDFSVFISTDGGNTHEAALVTGLQSVNWTQTDPIYLHQYRGQMVTLVFRGTSNHGEDDSFIYLDDVTVSEAPEYAAPLALSATDVTPHSAVLNWKGNGESAWTVRYKKAGDSDYTSIANVTAKPYTLENLDANTIYQYCVVANYPANYASDPSDEYAFRTQFEPITITADHPYTEDFENILGITDHNDVGFMPEGWEIDPEDNSAAPKVLSKDAQYNYFDSQALYFYGTGYNFAALPKFTNPIKSLEISFKYAFESREGGMLSLHFLTENDYSFDYLGTVYENGEAIAERQSIAVITSTNQSNFQPQAIYNVTKNLKYEVTNNANRLAFRWYNLRQLGCNVDDIEVRLATDCIEKNIVGYANDRLRWYLIAYPWYGEETATATGLNLIPTDGNENCIIDADTYDLYRFDPSNANGLEWENYKSHHGDAVNPFQSLVNGQAYLYANSSNTPLNFCGQPYIGERQVTLRKVEGTALSGWNLIGNPYTETTYIGKPYYRMNDDGSGLVAAAANTPIEPMEGIFVYADYDGEVVTFTETPQGNPGGLADLPALPLLLPTHGLSADQDATVRYTIALNDAADNTDVLADYSGKKADVTLSGRTLWKDGNWNTLCLPFSLTEAQVTAQLSPTALMTLGTAGFSGGTLTLNFVDAETIEAGKPYIIRWGTPDSHPNTNLVNPVFTGVIVSTASAPVETSYVDFIGTYSPTVIYEEGTDKHNLYLGGDNTLYYPTASGFKVNACRAYFQLKNGLTAGTPALSRLVLNFGDEETTSLNEELRMKNEEGSARRPEGESQFATATEWYTLDGRKLYKKPTKAGLYIHGGNKVVIK